MNATGATMARPKRAAKRPAPADDKGRTIGFRVSRPYGDWLERLAGKNRTTIAGLIDQALTRYAETIGFDDPPPER